MSVILYAALANAIQLFETEFISLYQLRYIAIISERKVVRLPKKKTPPTLNLETKNTMYMSLRLPCSSNYNYHS